LFAERILTSSIVKELVSKELDVKVEVPGAIAENREAEQVLLKMHDAGLVFFDFSKREVQLLSEAARDELKVRYRKELGAVL
jgi:hypothetical protein